MRIPPSRKLKPIVYMMNLCVALETIQYHRLIQSSAPFVYSFMNYLYLFITFILVLCSDESSESKVFITHLKLYKYLFS